jgi:UDP-N-acetylglucosamine 2-epimerase (non-hydrolysing)
MPVPVLLPVHPRTKARIDEDPRLEAAARGVRMIEPLGYPEFLALAAECAILVSDSGGVQEEASIIKRPVIVVRRSTERPEVIGTFAARVEPGEGFLDVARSWLTDLPSLHSRLAAVPSPYGDGLASERIAGELRNLIDG